MNFHQYVEHGWAICGLPKGEKSPKYKGWNTKPIPAAAADGFDGAGLLHALSKTCALDIDDMAVATTWLLERGVDLQALLEADDAVQISSGTKNRAKLIYRLSKPLRTVQPPQSGLELRCATGRGTSVHDALPGSTHPSGRLYTWIFGILGDYRNLPTIPANLLSLWRGLAEPIDPSAVDESAEPIVTKIVVDLVKLRKAVWQHDPNCDEDEWRTVMAQCNDATHGAVQGLDILDEWSKTATRDQHGKPGVSVYQGRAAIKQRYMSFKSTPGKHVASGAALLGELPADASDFEEMPPEVTDAAPPPSEPTGAAAKRKLALEKLIQRFVFVIWEQEYFDADRHTLIGDKAIRHMFTSKMPYKNSRLVDPVDELMRSRAKDFVEALAFHPGEKSIFVYDRKRYANTYTNRVVVPIEPMKYELTKIDWLFNRIEDVEYRSWMLQFLAHIVQHPGIKIRTAPLIWSLMEGNGKSTIVGRIPQLLVGRDYYSEVSQGELNSDHNDFLIGKWCISLAEFRAGSRGERESINKKVENWIADSVLAVHPKGTKGYSIPNHLVVTASTNKNDAALIGPANRKWAVHHFQQNGEDVPEMTEAEKTWIFEDFLNTDRAPGVLRHYFLNYPITTFSPHASAPKNAARQAMIESSIPPDLEYLITAFEQLSAPLNREVVITAEVGDDVRRHCRTQTSNDRIGRLLVGAPFNGQVHQWRVGQSRYRGVILRNIGYWRTAPGKVIMAHVGGDDAAVAIVDELLL